ncbi:unnamed protein product, partial [Mesorhabditis spiculigera]
MHGLGLVFLATIGIGRGLVESAAVESTSQSLPIATETEKAIEESMLCWACELVVQEIEEMVAPEIKTEIGKAINNACSKLWFDMLKAKCVTVLTALAADLAQYIADHQAPKVACKAVGLCKGGQFCLPN